MPTTTILHSPRAKFATLGCAILFTLAWLHMGTGTIAVHAQRPRLPAGYERDDYLQDEDFEERFRPDDDVHVDIDPYRDGEYVPRDEITDRHLLGREMEIEVDDYLQDEHMERRFLGYDDDIEVDDYMLDEYSVDRLGEVRNPEEAEGIWEADIWDAPSIYIDRTDEPRGIMPDSYGYPYGSAHPHAPVMAREDLERGIVRYYTDDWADGTASFDEWYDRVPADPDGDLDVGVGVPTPRGGIDEFGPPGAVDDYEVERLRENRDVEIGEWYQYKPIE